MLSTTQALAGFLLAAAGALATDPGAGLVTAAAVCGGEHPCAPSATKVPTCATACIESAASAVGCVHGDYPCQCEKYGDIQLGALDCVLGGCGEAAVDVIFAVDSLCACVREQPPCTSAPTSTTTTPPVVPSSSAPPKPTWTPLCPGNQCTFPDASRPEFKCISDCYNAGVASLGMTCNTIEDWNCVCPRHNSVYSKARPCAVACGVPDLLKEWTDAMANGCTCIKAACPVSSSSTPVPPTSTTTPAPSSTITEGPECPHPCSDAIAAVPTCATSCIKSAAAAVGCGGDDYDCRCASAAAIQDKAISCVLGACQLADALKAADQAKVVCACNSASPATSCAGPTSTAVPSSTITEGPECPHPCSDAIAASAAAAVGCGGDDYDCRCASAAAIQDKAIGCVLGACQLADALKAADQAKVVCAPECIIPCADEIAAVPGCATACITSAASAVGCGGSDYDCRCSSLPSRAFAPASLPPPPVSCTSAGTGGPSGGVTHITKTIDETTTVCATETSTPKPPKPSCTKGHDGKPCGEDSDDESDGEGSDGEGSDGEGSDGDESDGEGSDGESDCEGSGCHGGGGGGPKPSVTGGPKPSGTGGGSGPKPTKSEGGGGEGPKPTKTSGGGGGGGEPTGKPTSTGKPPVTGGASGVVMAGTGCLAGIIAVVVAFM
ncbi:hypothetical protein N0V88_003848 [Collariella sp. IMI 366227]|nr:hypothetical protein N0V88_003848 [Collariella sp. IMI 366227]